MPKIQLDSLSQNVGECFAVVYTPKRRRERFPENCVEVVADMATALEKADPEQQRHAARVVGPCRSSEGFRLYYLVRWLR